MLKRRFPNGLRGQYQSRFIRRLPPFLIPSRSPIRPVEMAVYINGDAGSDKLPTTRYRTEGELITLTQEIPMLGKNNTIVEISAASLLPQLASECLAQATTASKRSHLKEFMLFLRDTNLQMTRSTSSQHPIAFPADIIFRMTKWLLEDYEPTPGAIGSAQSLRNYTTTVEQYPSDTEGNDDVFPTVVGRTMHMCSRPPGIGGQRAEVADSRMDNEIFQEHGSLQMQASVPERVRRASPGKQRAPDVGGTRIRTGPDKGSFPLSPRLGLSTHGA